MNLEAQLNEARKAACQSNSNVDQVSDVQSNSESLKIVNLESKTNHLEQQVALILSKLETIQPQSETLNIQRTYSCDVCDDEFPQKSNLQKHKEESHGNLLKCDTCNFTATNDANLEVHKRKHMEQFTCSGCNFKFGSKSQLSEHRCKYHIKCKECSYYAIHSKDLRRHFTIMHPQKLSCDLCPHKAKNNAELQNHKNDMHMSM